MDALLLKFKNQAANFVRNVSPNDLEIDLLGIFPFSVRSPHKSQTIIGPYIQIQLASGTEGICIAYTDVDIKSDFQYVGSDAMSIIDHVQPEVQIAIIDAVFQMINERLGIQPTKTVEFNGTAVEKAIERAQFVTSLLEPREEDKIGVIGCVEPMVRCLVDKGSKVRLADLHSSLDSICGIKVERDAQPILEWADKVILTGNALWSQTMDQILRKASEHHVTTLVYAMTGHHIAPHYLECGASIVTAEYFPFYWFSNVKSKLEVYRQK